MNKRIDRINNFRYPVSQPTVFDEEELTVLELVSKVAYTINETVDGVNEWFDYLDNFVEQFEFELQVEVKETLIKWQNEGILDDIINSALKTRLDDFEIDLIDYKTSTNDKLENNYRRITEIGVSVLDYGATGDGVTDDTQAFIAASNSASINNSTLIIPNGDFVINGSINIYTDVLCFGQVIRNTEQTTPLFNILPNQDVISVDVSTLSGLERGSKRIVGLKGYRGDTVILSSNERLIKRFNHDAEGNLTGDYYKQEVALITDDNGTITPTLDCSYTDTSKLSVTVVPREKQITISGLSVEIVGEEDTVVSVINVGRSGVTFNDVSIFRVGTGIVSTFVSVNNCVNIVFNKLNISGGWYSGLGYGVSFSRAALVSLNNCSVHDFRHAISGRHVKDVVINGGSYSDDIDCHWGNNFIIDGVTLYNSVGYCGTDIVIRNSNITTGNHVLAIRLDTPEMSGRIIIENNTIVQTGVGYLEFVYYASATPGTYTGFSFGRVLDSPRLVVIKNNYVTMSEEKTIRYVQMVGGIEFEHKPIEKIIVSGNKSKNKNVKTVNVWKHSVYTKKPNINPIIIIENEELNGSEGVPTFMCRQDGGEETTWGYELYLTRCGDIGIRADGLALSKVVVDTCTVRFIQGINDQTQMICDGYFINCLIKNCSIQVMMYFTFYNCILDGTVKLYNATNFLFLDVFKLSQNTVATNEAVGWGGSAVPIPFDKLLNYRNPIFYRND